MSSNTSFTLQADDDISVLRMHGPKANSLSPQLLAELRQALEAAALAPTRGLVLLGDGRVFSAGLALPHIVDFDRDELRAFMQTFAATMERVLTFPKATVAAINGHAIAGGCVLALMCDWRVMATGDSRIGLNEVALGIGLPSIVMEPLRVRVRNRALPQIALSGLLFTGEAALGLDLVDELVALGELEAISVAKARWLGDASDGFTQVKRSMLAPVIAALRATEVAELESWLDTWYAPEAQLRVRAAVKLMTGRA